jgi:hypothetical protein
MIRWHYCWPLLVLALGCGGRETGGSTAPATERSGTAAADFHGGTTLNAGEVDYARSRDFTFPFANTGGAPLVLTLEKKSCSCAEVKLPDGPIAPGGEGQVEINWAPIPGHSGDYDVVATLRTNDPQAREVRLTVHTFIKPLVRVFINGKETNDILDFGDAPILPNQPLTREVKVFSTELAAFSLEASTPVAGLRVVKKPLPSGERLGEYAVRSGYVVEVTAGDKLPLGYLRTTLDLALSGLGDQPNRTITVPVYAIVGSGAVSVTPETFLFQKPRITEEAEAKVHLFVNSAEAGAVTVESWSPKFLTVDAPKKEANGKWLLVARLPKDNPEAAKYQPDSFMEGEVVLKVAGIDRPVKIRVKWQPVGK